MLAAKFVQLAQQRVRRSACNINTTVSPSHRSLGDRFGMALSVSFRLLCRSQLTLSGGGPGLQAHLDALKERHAALETRIADEDQRPGRQRDAYAPEDQGMSRRRWSGSIRRSGLKRLRPSPGPVAVGRRGPPAQPARSPGQWRRSGRSGCTAPGSPDRAA